MATTGFLNLMQEGSHGVVIAACKSDGGGGFPTLSFPPRGRFEGGLVPGSTHQLRPVVTLEALCNTTAFHKELFLKKLKTL